MKHNTQKMHKAYVYKSVSVPEVKHRCSDRCSFPQSICSLLGQLFFFSDSSHG